MATTYYTLLTTVGKAKLANAVALGQTIALTQMAIGDGNGNPTTPSEGQTALVREVYRASLSRLAVDPNNSAYVTAEAVVPTSVGGWTVREVGIYDEDGLLFAVANFPASYKPILDEGSGRDLVIRIIMEISNASAITLLIDPTVVIASRSWVVDNFSFGIQVPGGLTNQFLRKRTNADGDVEWSDIGEVELLFPAIVEEQELAENQTAVSLATVGTQGMALYIEGAREFAFTIQDATHFTLSRSYPEGTRIWVVQNDPLGEINSESVGYGTSNVKAQLDMQRGLTSQSTAENQNKYTKLATLPTIADGVSAYLSLNFALHGNVSGGASIRDNGMLTVNIRRNGSNYLIKFQTMSMGRTDPSRFVLARANDGSFDLFALITTTATQISFAPALLSSTWVLYNNGALLDSVSGYAATQTATEAKIGFETAHVSDTAFLAKIDAATPGAVIPVEAPLDITKYVKVAGIAPKANKLTFSSDLLNFMIGNCDPVQIIEIVDNAAIEVKGFKTPDVDGWEMDIIVLTTSQTQPRNIALSLNQSVTATNSKILSARGSVDTVKLTGNKFKLRYSQADSAWIVVEHSNDGRSTLSITDAVTPVWVNSYSRFQSISINVGAGNPTINGFAVPPADGWAIDVQFKGNAAPHLDCDVSPVQAGFAKILCGSDPTFTGSLSNLRYYRLVFDSSLSAWLVMQTELPS